MLLLMRAWTLTDFLDVLSGFEHAPELELVHGEFIAVVAGASDSPVVRSADHELVIPGRVHLVRSPHARWDVPVHEVSIHVHRQSLLKQPVRRFNLGKYLDLWFVLHFKFNEKFV